MISENLSLDKDTNPLIVNLRIRDIQRPLKNPIKILALYWIQNINLTDKNSELK